MTRVPRLLVIDPSVGFPEDQGVAEVLAGWPGESRVLRPSLSPGDGPGPGDGYDADGIVVLGSRASVHDQLPWIGPLGEWLAPLLDGRVRRPLLGVCFGHQLVAHLAAGAVEFLDSKKTKRLGVEPSRFGGSRLVPGEATLRVIVSHRESVTCPPGGYETVARREGVPFDGLQHPDLPVFTVQFHPEARDEFMQSAGIDEALLDDEVVRDSRRVLDGFTRVVLRDTP